jgi:hypothetical protein
VSGSGTLVCLLLAETGNMSAQFPQLFAPICNSNAAKSFRFSFARFGNECAC